MSIFNKTTGIDFQEFGEIFNETTFKNQYVEGRFYLTIDKKETNKSTDNVAKAVGFLSAE